MKKLASLTLVILVLMVMVAPAAAGGKWVDAQQAPLYPVLNGSSNNVLMTEPAQGKVVLVDPMGAVSLIIQGEATGLVPFASYDVWVRDLDPGYTGTYLFKYAPLGYYKLVRFVADEYGVGSFHVNLRAEDLSDGTYTIQVAINTASEMTGSTVLATQWPGLTVTVKE